MSGHSKWAKIHRQKSTADAKRGATFTKLGNAITVATRQGGDDPETNFKLRLTIEKAKAANMPKDNIDRAIKRGTGAGQDANQLESVNYEIFGPNGSVFIAETITDNKNRTIAEIKSILNKNQSQLGEPNSVLWMFELKGMVLIIINSNSHSHETETLELSLIDAGAEEIIKKDQTWKILTPPNNLPALIENLNKLNLEIEESGLIYWPKNKITISDPTEQEKIKRLLAALEENDDINNVYTNVSW